MSFWKFGSFAQQSAIDTLLNAASGPSTPNNVGSLLDPSNASQGSSSSHHQADHVPILTLEQLLEEDDLLQECKNGHTKLIDFLSRPRVVRRLLDYVDGSAFEAEDEVPSTPSESEARQRKRIKYPHVCTEIILCNVHSITQELLRDLDIYIKPFWSSVLDRFPTGNTSKTWFTANSGTQLGYWTKVNSFLLAERPFEMIAYFKSNPSLVSRIIQHVPSSTAISDLIFRYIQTEELGLGRGVIEYLCATPELSLVSRMVEYLSPEYPAETHASVAEFIKAIINFCSTANANAANAEFSQPPPTSASQSNGLHTAWGQAKPSGNKPEEKEAHWVDGRFLRELASEKTISRLMQYIFDDLPLTTHQEDSSTDQARSKLPDKHTIIQPRSDTLKDFVATPSGSAEASLNNSVTLPSPSTSQPSQLRFPTNPTSPFTKSAPTPASATSSLTNCLAILIDLIRKNNSDFSEQQILHYLRKRLPPDPDPPSSAGEKPKSNLSSSKPSSSAAEGPSIVYLGHVLRLMSARMGDFQSLLKHPRSSTAPMSMTQGPVTPLSQERFRICEVYAELLHCSNMALLNRRSGEGPQYDETGRLPFTEEALAILDSTISTPLQQHDDAESTTTVDVESVTTSTYNSPINSTDDSLQLPEGMDEISLNSPAQSPAVGRVRVMESIRPESIPEQESVDDAVASNASADAPKSGKEPATAGNLLKTKLLEHNVIEVLLDLFFEYPWNNFLHNVVYDLLQQTFNGRLDNSLSRKLCLRVFTDNDLTGRIIKGQALNDQAASDNKGIRMGYMGHMSLIAEEVCKILSHYPEEIHEPVKDSISPAWSSYVANVLRTTRQNDTALLGGGVNSSVNDTISSASGMSDDDDEFPMSSRSSRILGLDANEGSEHVETKSSPSTQNGKTNDQFARYLIQQISSDLPDKFTSSSDEEEDEWQSSGFDPKHSDFGLWESDRKSAPLKTSAEQAFGDFESPTTASKGKSGFDDSFGSSHKNLTPADWNSEFKNNFDDDAPITPFSEGDPFASPDDDEDDFGEFTSASATAEDGQIALPAFNDDFADFDANASGSGFNSAFDDGGSVFDRLAEVVDPSKEHDREDGLVEVDDPEHPSQKIIVPRDEAEIAAAKVHSRPTSVH